MPPATIARPAAGDLYFRLTHRFPLRPILSDSELSHAVAVMNELVDREGLSPDEDDYLAVLGDLVESYEAKNHSVTPVSDAAMIRHLLDARDLTQAKLAQDTGISESTISAVVNGQRKLTRDHVAVLADYFKIGQEAFLVA